ncbi:MAG: hypothetical protein IT184_13525 [Acidobacteria bacterium]|nr:hypothetical protein [Acidobacteriota bacterium]
MELQLAHANRHLAYFHGLTMLPVLREGDEVRLEPVAWRDVRVGDVVTYRFEDKFPTRRVVAIDRRRGRFVIMGDSIPGRREYLVPFEDVLARVVGRRRDDVWLATSSWSWRWHTIGVLWRDHIRRAAWLAAPRALWIRARRYL